MVKFQAYGDYVIISPDKEKVHETESGLIMTEKQMEEVRYGEASVVSSPIEDIKEGTRIIFDRAGGYNVPINGKVYRIIKLRDIAAYG